MADKDSLKKSDKNNKNVLCGGNNKRLDNKNPTNNESTAAWANTEKLQDRTKVNIPSDYSVMKAKNWVDNGSQT